MNRLVTCLAALLLLSGTLVAEEVEPVRLPPTSRATVQHDTTNLETTDALYADRYNSEIYKTELYGVSDHSLYEPLFGNQAFVLPTLPTGLTSGAGDPYSNIYSLMMGSEEPPKTVFEETPEGLPQGFSFSKALENYFPEDKPAAAAKKK